MIDRYAVIGSTGFLGGTFFEKSHSGVELIPVDRKTADLTKNFELHLSDFFKRNPVQAAIITSAISSPDECKANPELSHKVNVDGTIRLFKLLKGLGIKPVFFSTDHVYDGQKGNYNEGDPYSPVTVYGQQKTQAENFLREHFDEFLILRTSKQVSTRIDRKNILSEMTVRLLTGRTIRCATDHSIAPIFAEDVVTITLDAVRKGLSGPLHLAPPQTYTRLELGHAVADALSTPRTLVEPCSIHDFKFLETRPPFCTLDSSLLQKFLNPKFIDLKDGIARIVANRRVESARFNCYTEPVVQS